MDDLVRDIFPIRRTLDDGVDEAEASPFRHARTKTSR